MMVSRPSSAQQYVLKPEIRNPYNSPTRELMFQRMPVNIRQFFPPPSNSPSRDSDVGASAYEYAEDHSNMNESVSENMEIED